MGLELGKRNLTGQDVVEVNKWGRKKTTHYSELEGTHKDY